jgi:DsbC/DsbD-like thiol-disulfide interchange protein
VSILLLAAVPALTGQAPQPAKAVIDTPHLTLTTSSNGAGAGARASLYVDVAPKPKMHVYAPQEKDAIPMSLTLAPSDAFKAAPVEFPKPEQFFFEPVKLTQLIYSKPFRITQPLTIAKTARGPLTIKGTIRYQACDDKVCYIPKTIPVAWTLSVN